MSACNRVTPVPVEFVPMRSFRFAPRFVLCLVLTVLNAGVTAFSGVTLYRAAAGHTVQLAGVTLAFAALLGSLVSVWIVAMRTRFL